MCIGLEAFQYEAEFGSIKTLVWALTLVEKMSDYDKDCNQQYTILVYIGFTMYNYVKDTKLRYAIPDDEVYQSYHLFERYNVLVNRISEESVGRRNHMHLTYLADAIYVAFMTFSLLKHGIMNLQLAMEKSRRVLDDSSCPSILKGVHHYLTGTLHYLDNKSECAQDSYFFRNAIP